MFRFTVPFCLVSAGGVQVNVSAQKKVTARKSGGGGKRKINWNPASAHKGKMYNNWSEEAMDVAIGEHM